MTAVVSIVVVASIIALFVATAGTVWGACRLAHLAPCSLCKACFVALLVTTLLVAACGGALAAMRLAEPDSPMVVFVIPGATLVAILVVPWLTIRMLLGTSLRGALATWLTALVIGSAGVVCVGMGAAGGGRDVRRAHRSDGADDHRCPQPGRLPALRVSLGRVDVGSRGSRCRVWPAARGQAGDLRQLRLCPYGVGQVRSP